MSFRIPLELLDLLRSKGIGFLTDHDVSSRSSFRVSGLVALAIFPKSRNQLVESVKALDSFGIRFEILGNASNLLFAFEVYHGAFIFTDKISSVFTDGNKIIADAGVPLTHLANVAAASSLSGLEFAFGIPALVGGAVYMNAGAYGGQMSDAIEYTVAYDREKDLIYRIYNGGFSYRKSCYMSRPLVCLGAAFMLVCGNETEIKAKMVQNMVMRRDKQPLEYPSAGSYFKRPEGYFAGKLIEDCGLKGFRVGDAKVSEKHAGFIINVGNATFGDILELEEKIKERVRQEFGVTLEREVRVIAD